MIYKKGYIDGPYGQLHYHCGYPEPVDYSEHNGSINQAASQTPLVLFHQSPKSAFEYRHLIRAMATDRFVIAFDTPGYGESDGPDEPASMPELTAAMATGLKKVLADFGISGSVDAFGFHTGGSIATELAISEAKLVRRVVLSGVPYFDKKYSKERVATLPKEIEVDEDGAFIMKRWEWVVQKRAAGVSVLEAAKSFVQDIHALNKSRHAYHAFWSYPTADYLPQIKQPILIVQPHELLLEETRESHRKAIPHAEMIEIPHIIDDVFDTGWKEIAETMKEWLDNNS